MSCHAIFKEVRPSHFFVTASTYFSGCNEQTLVSPTTARAKCLNHHKQLLWVTNADDVKVKILFRSKKSTLEKVFNDIILESLENNIVIK